MTGLGRTTATWNPGAAFAGSQAAATACCGAGASAALSGVVAAHTTLPVIGVPINATPLNGMDALLSTVQMPPGVPVAAVAVGVHGAKNAALLALRILSVGDKVIEKKLENFKQEQKQKILDIKIEN